MRPLPAGCLPLLLLAALLLPLFLANAMLAALAELGLSPGASLAAALGIFLGGLVNVPVKRLAREEPVETPILTLFGLDRFVAPRTRHRYTIIAVNLGGCVVPCGLAAYQLARLANGGLLAAAIIAAAVNTLVCYAVARPVQNVGIAMPALVPALTAAVSALVLAPEAAAPVAFCAGVLGPLVGADLMHLRDIQRISTGAASIGGAGTFDGIVLSGLVATLLAAAVE